MNFRLTQLKQDDWVLVDADKQPGGLAGSFKTPEGFRFDHGYMVIPTRYEYIQKLLEELGPPREGEKKTKEFIDFIEKVRNNFVYIRGNLVKYPIQNNLCGLPPKEQADSVADLMKAQLLLKHIPEDAPKPNNLGNYQSSCISHVDVIWDCILQQFTAPSYKGGGTRSEHVGSG